MDDGDTYKDVDSPREDLSKSKLDQRKTFASRIPATNQKKRNQFRPNDNELVHPPNDFPPSLSSSSEQPNLPDNDTPPPPQNTERPQIILRSSEFFGNIHETTSLDPSIRSIKIPSGPLGTPYTHHRSLSNPFPPAFVIQCDNPKNSNLILKFLETTKDHFKTESDAEALLKLFNQNEILNKRNSGEALDVEDLMSGDKDNVMVEWSMKLHKKRIPYPQDFQKIIENAYRHQTQQLNLGTSKDNGSLRTIFKDGNITIDFEKMIQTSKDNTNPSTICRRVQNIYTQGWVLRESRKLKFWRLTYLVLTSSAIHYYSDDSMTEDVHLDQFYTPLQLLVSVRFKGVHDGKDFVLEVDTCKEEDTFYFSVQNEHIAQKWIYFMQLAQKRLLTRMSKMVVKKPTGMDKQESELLNGQYSLCFCSISTAAYKFNLEIASTVACDVFKEFLEAHKDPRINIYLVDIQEDSETIKLFKKKKPNDQRLIIKGANLVKLKDHKIPCWYIVNASNPKFNEGGTGTNEAIHEACRGPYTPSLQTLTKRAWGEIAEVGRDYAVDLPEGCPLREYQNVHTVIHVVGPNMNPKKQNYLGEDYEKGKSELRKSYLSVLNCFLKKTGLQ